MASRTRTGVASILAGVLYFIGQGGELVFGDSIPNGVYVSFGVAGFVALAVALWGLRELLDAVGLHDIGLFVFEGAWVGLGVAVVRAKQHEVPHAAVASA